MLPIITALFAIFMVLTFIGFYAQGMMWLAVVGLALFTATLLYALSRGNILRA